MREALCVVVGSRDCGKSSLIAKFCLDEHPAAFNKYEEILDPISKAVEDGGGDVVSLTITDTKSNTWELLDSKGLPDAQCVVLCMDLSRNKAILDLKETWLPRLRSLWPTAKILAVGTKLDLKEHSTADITRSDLDCYWSPKDTSALTGEGLKELFRETVRLCLKQMEEEDRERKSASSGICNIL